MSKRVGLVGCVKEKRAGTAAAEDLYMSPLFVGRRRYVERTCDEWWILSAEHGLVHPRDVIAPYDKTLRDASRADRRAWAEQVLRVIDQRIEFSAGDTVEIHAGSDYRDYGLVGGLFERGVSVENPTQGMRVGEQLRFYSRWRNE
jgi:hypothetical protein